MAIAAAILTAAQIAYGLYQNYKAKEASEAEPEIPKSAEAALSMARDQAARTEMPGQSMLEDKLASQAATAANRMLEASGGSGAALGGLAQINQQVTDKMGDIQMNQAAYADQQRKNLMGQLGNMANWEAQGHQMNQEQARRLQESGVQNIWGGATSYVQGLQTKGMWDDYIGLQESQINASRQAFSQPRATVLPTESNIPNEPFNINPSMPSISNPTEFYMPGSSKGQIRWGEGIPNFQQPGQFMYPYQQEHPLSYLHMVTK